MFPVAACCTPLPVPRRCALCCHRSGVAFVDCAYRAMDAAEVAMDWDEGEELDRAIAMEAAAAGAANGGGAASQMLRGAESEREEEERLEELEQGLEDDLDDVPDLPAVDMV